MFGDFFIQMIFVFVIFFLIIKIFLISKIVDYIDRGVTKIFSNQSQINMSRASQKRNTTGVAKSVGKTSSAGGNSFAQSKGSQGAFMNQTAKSQNVNNGQVGPNIVIDIESENLTYNQARSIRLQL